MNRTLAAILPVLLSLPGVAAADPGKKCNEHMLKGEYVLSASGFTRPVGSAPGTTWVPKAILEVIQFNGNGTLATPSVVVANPFGDVGLPLGPMAGASGTYVVNDDCTGSVTFNDPNHVTYQIVVDHAEGHTVRMIQTNPPQNVFEGSARRVR
jgi:hypothetical protein